MVYANNGSLEMTYEDNPVLSQAYSDLAKARENLYYAVESVVINEDALSRHRIMASEDGRLDGKNESERKLAREKWDLDNGRELFLAQARLRKAQMEFDLAQYKVRQIRDALGIVAVNLDV